MTSPDLTPTLLTTHRVHPSSPAPPMTTPLSIVDATTATYAPSSAIWVYDAPTHPYTPFQTSSQTPSQTPLNPLTALLHTSLRQTLTSYPHLAGALTLTPYPLTPQPPHTSRFRRCNLTHGHPSDPGVLLETAHLPASAAALFPSPSARATTHKTWDATPIDFQRLFLPAEPLPVQKLVSTPGAAGVQIRVTELQCGGVVIGCRMAHPLADAGTLVRFVGDWGRVTRAVRGKKEELWGRDGPRVEAVFRPGLLDGMAAGDVDAAEPDQGVLRVAEGLALARFDWWADEGRPGWLEGNAQVVIPDEVPPNVAASRRPGQRIPWEEWDKSLPVSHRIVRIFGDEVDRLYSLATEAGKAVTSGTTSGEALLAKESRISRHDVILAFVWQLIARARPVDKSDEGKNPRMFIDTTLGLRPRLGLPSSYVGSPVMLTSLAATYEEVTGIERKSAGEDKGRFPNARGMAQSAIKLRKHTIGFDVEKVCAWLHEMAFEVAPQRIWNGFLGKRHTMATSWVRVGIWDVDFGFCGESDEQSGRDRGCVAGLRWAGNVMPVLDGLVTVTEAKTNADKGSRDWWRGGVDVDINLETSTMGRALQMLATWRGEA